MLRGHKKPRLQARAAVRKAGLSLLPLRAGRKRGEGKKIKKKNVKLYKDGLILFLIGNLEMARSGAQQPQQDKPGVWSPLLTVLCHCPQGSCAQPKRPRGGRGSVLAQAVKMNLTPAAHLSRKAGFPRLPHSPGREGGTASMALLGQLWPAALQDESFPSALAAPPA